MVVRSAAYTSVTTAQASCNAGEKAVGGGYVRSSGSFNVTAFEPVPTTGTPTGWQVSFSGNWTGTVYVLCVS